MKIGSKITLFYTVMTMGCIVLIMGVCYVFMSKHIDTLFDNYLYEKAILTAQKHWEKDEVDAKSYHTIQKRYADLLPQAREVLVDTKDTADLSVTLDKYLTHREQSLLYRQQKVSFQSAPFRGCAIYYPDNEGTFIVLVMAQNEYGTQLRQHMLLLGVVVLVASCVLIYLLGRFYARRILHPFNLILDKLKRIRGNDLDTRIEPLNNNDEIDKLIHALNEMLDRIGQAFQAEKSFINNASHELNNPLTAIQMECEINLLRERTPQEYADALQRIQTESQRISSLIKNLLFLSREDKDLMNCTEQIPVAGFFQSLCEEFTHVQLHDELSDKGLCIIGNSFLLHIAFKNIIGNAVKYSGKEVDVCMHDCDGKLRVTVTDHGIGIPKEEIQSIFQSFYRASNARPYQGHGVGLSLSQRIITLHKGRLAVDSEEDKYTQFTVILPIEEE